MTPRQTIVEQARTWLGTPYLHQGRTKGVAVDCIGLIIGVSAELGHPIIAPDDYTASPNGDMLMKHARRQFVEIMDRKVPVPGDIMVLWGWNRREPQHFAYVGLIGGRLSMIHAFSKRKEVVEHAIDSFWQNRLVALFNIPGTEPA